MSLKNKAKQYYTTRVPCAFTVSVTGHGDIAETEALQIKTEQVLKQIADTCIVLNDKVKLRLNTALSAGADQIAARAILSANEKTEQQRWALQVIVPFERQSYCEHLAVGLPETHPPIAQSFEDLIEQADTVFELADLEVIPPVQEPDIEEARTQYWQSQRYRTLGNLLAKQADLILAIWDGRPAGGPGGTADVVALALAQDKSIIRIDPHTQLVTFLKPSNKDHIRLARQGDERQDGDSLISVKGELYKQIAKVIRQPAWDDGKNDVDEVDEDRIKQLFSSADAFFGTANLHRRELSNTSFFYRLLRNKKGKVFPESTTATSWYYPYQWLVKAMDLLCVQDKPPEKIAIEYKQADKIDAEDDSELPFGMRVNFAEDDWSQPPYCPKCAQHTPTTQPQRFYNQDTPRPKQLNSIDQRLRTPMIATDAIATARAHAYRSSYVVNFLVGAIAVWIGLAGLLREPKFAFVMVEVVILFLLLLSYYLAKRRCWHERWLNARFITETLRAGRFLCWLGMGGRRTLKRNAPWVAWYTNTVMASIPSPDGTLKSSDLRRIARELRCHVINQINYHSGNASKLKKVHRGLEGIGFFCLVAAISIAIFFIIYSLKYGYNLTFVKETGYLVSVLCAGFPALAGAVLGIRYQGDFELFAKRSVETQRELREINQRLDAMIIREVEASHQPLFEELSQIVTSLNQVYEHDLDDWYYVYSARPNAEPG